MEKVDNKFYLFSDKNIPNVKSIYGIYNIKTDKIYIGSCNNLHSRILKHKYYLNKNKHHSQKLQRSWNIHKDSFIIILIKEVTNDFDREKLIKIEKEYIDLFNSFYEGYNSINNTKYVKSFKLSNEQINKITLKSTKKVVCLDLNGSYICEYSSLTEAAKRYKRSNY
jgi:hypothetical protein